MSELPLASIIIPCSNEGKYVRACLDSVIENSFPEEVVNAYTFEYLDQVYEISRGWLRTYNKKQCHETVGSVSGRLPGAGRIEGNLHS